MVKYREISDSDLKRISEEFKVSQEILNKIITEWSYYIYTLDDNINNPDPAEPTDIEQRMRDWAELSLFFHKNRLMLESENPAILKEASFKPVAKDKNPIKISGYFANQIMASYLSSLNKKGNLLGEEMAEMILNEKTKSGNRISQIGLIQITLIMIAYSCLKPYKPRSYAPIIVELLSISGITDLSYEAIRTAVSRHKK